MKKLLNNIVAAIRGNGKGIPMKTLLKNLVARISCLPKSPKAAKPRAAFRPAMEGLEERSCPAALSLTQAVQAIQFYNAALQTKNMADVQGLVVHVASVESQSPSLLGAKGSKLFTDLAQMYTDAKANAFTKVSADFKNFVQDLAVEAALVKGFHLANRLALLVIAVRSPRSADLPYQSMALT